MKKTLNIKELATNLVGDGKRPNKYFVTVAYGWYKPFGEDAEMIQADKSPESVTVLFNKKEDAENYFDGVRLHGRGIKEITGETIGQVIIEDRLTGTIKEKYLEQTKDGNFFINCWY